jgi:hypothetical protein
MSRATIPGRVVEIRYQRSGVNAGLYRHRFGPGVRMQARADGSVRLHGPRRIHADDRARDFDRYVNPPRGGRAMSRRQPPRRRRRRARAESGLSWWWLGALALLVRMRQPQTVYSGGGREPINYWINPDTGALVYQPGVDPPPGGFRPASENEIAATLPGLM